MTRRHRLLHLTSSQVLLFLHLMLGLHVLQVGHLLESFVSLLYLPTKGAYHRRSRHRLHGLGLQKGLQGVDLCHHRVE